MDVSAAVLEVADIKGALELELRAPPRALPPDSLYSALTGREDEVAEWVHDRLTSGFTPTPEETVSVSKGRHGIRPVAVWDIPSRLAYRALAARLESRLPPLQRTRSQWLQFQRAPLQRSGKYVVASDIASCYQHLDHGLLFEELLVQTGAYEALEVLATLLREARGRTYGLPQQSRPSDVLAEPFLARLERALVRRGLDVDRYNDDFRFTCNTWSQVVRSLEVLEEEARLVGLSVNDSKTTTWRTTKYEGYLDEVDQLRQQIADDARLDLTVFDTDPYTGDTTKQDPDPDAVDLLAAVRVLERWSHVAGRGNVASRRRAEHRAVVELLPYALSTLGVETQSDSTVLDRCTRMLRFERTLTPAVATYLLTRQDDASVVAAFDRLLRSRSYLNGWQIWWLQAPVARRASFLAGAGAKRRLAWAHAAFASSEQTPVLRAEAARTLALHHRISVEEMLRIYDRSSDIVRPVLAAGIALLKPSASVGRAVTGDSRLNAWAYEKAANQT